jgi:hypothetical protein
MLNPLIFKGEQEIGSGKVAILQARSYYRHSDFRCVSIEQRLLLAVSSSLRTYSCNLSTACKSKMLKLASFQPEMKAEIRARFTPPAFITSDLV